MVSFVKTSILLRVSNGARPVSAQQYHLGGEVTFTHRLYRLYHFGLRLAAALLPIRTPHVYAGQQALSQWLCEVKKQNLRTLLVVSDPGIVALNLQQPIIAALHQQGVNTVLYSDVEANPGIPCIEQGVSCYQQHHCQGIIAIGGGSVMDCGKLIAARIARPSKSLQQMQGLFKVLRPLVPLYAVPTTAGTGSEVTVAAVVSDHKRQIKFAINDLCLVPKGVLLLPELTLGLSPQLSATTAIDALTHAIESYIGINATRFSKAKSVAATKLILTHLPLVYQQPNHIDARMHMLWAAFYAGQAFTRTSVGYVHAIAHQLGALYGIGHGLANALLLAPVLNAYGQRIDAQLTALAQQTLAANSDAQDMRAAIATLLHDCAIPSTIAQLRQEDITTIAKRAIAEAHPDYPVPCFFNQHDIETILYSLLPQQQHPKQTSEQQSLTGQYR